MTGEPLDVEVYSAVFGERKGNIWAGVLTGYAEGTPVSVNFEQDRDWLMEVHQRDQNLIGFYHTHPTFPATPSSTDIGTMQAWVFSLGRPLICYIRGTDGLKGYLFRNDESYGQRLTEVRDFGMSNNLTLIIGTLYGRQRFRRRARREVSGKELRSPE